jgi:hypothetical protein
MWYAFDGYFSAQTPNMGTYATGQLSEAAEIWREATQGYRHRSDRNKREIGDPIIIQVPIFVFDLFRKSPKHIQP